MDRLSVIILTRNKQGYTQACLEGLLRTAGVELEAIVVDNGSTDGTVELLETMGPRFARAGAVLRTRLNPANLGCCTARNQGLAMATGAFCAFMDNDVTIADPAWGERLTAVLQCEPQAGLVSPKLTYPISPHRIQCAGVGVSRTGRILFRGRGEPRDAPEYNVRRACQALISACVVFPRSLYQQIGGLDEVFNPIEYEDIDFCYRARAAGYRALYEPSVELHHWESITSEGTVGLPNTYLIVKHGMVFKERWRHMFEHEDGPSDEECRWRRLVVPSLDGERLR
jgi:GT2 family glycosyltransferase